jgi:hypothetical protein
MGVRNVTYNGGGAIYEGKMTPRKEDRTRKRCRRARDKKKIIKDVEDVSGEQKKMACKPAGL